MWSFKQPDNLNYDFMKIRNLSLCVAFLCLSSSAMFSQDLIVTKEGDSLKCKITGIDKENNENLSHLDLSLGLSINL